MRHLLDEHREVVEALRDALLDRDELVGEEIAEVLASARIVVLPPDPAVAVDPSPDAPIRHFLRLRASSPPAAC